MEKDLVLAGLPVRFTSSDDDFYLQALPVDGDTDLEAVFREFCQPGDDFVDVGANIGVTAVLAARAVDPGRVVALEPVSSTFGYLERNITAAGLKHVTCRRLAVAAAPGEVSLVSRPGFGFAAYVGHAEGLAGYADHPAPALPLDQLVADEGLEHLRFVKIDVEGYELEVLRGATAVLDRDRPVVFLESNHYCLNIFHQISLVDFAAEILSLFPFVFALDFTAGMSIFDLTVSGNLPAFYHESVVTNRFANLICGFDPDMGERLERIQNRKADAASVLDTEDQGPVADGSVTMTVSRRERDSILLKRRVVNTVKGRLSPPGDATAS